jgi:alpha-ketoglutarate-dependent taurine dioxygenase
MYGKATKKPANSASGLWSKGLLMRLPHSDWLDALCREGYYAGNLGPLTAGELVQLGCQLGTLGKDLTPSPVMDVKRVPDSEYVTLTRSKVPFHNDGVYRRLPPRYLMLYCQAPGSRGGDTLLARGDLLARRLDRKTRVLLGRLRVRYTLGASSASRRLLLKHPRDGTPVIFFGDPGLAENMRLAAAGGTQTERVIAQLRTALGDPRALCHRQRWQRHDLLIIDNYKVLHARTAYQGNRILKRVEIAPKA